MKKAYIKNKFLEDIHNSFQNGIFFLAITWCSLVSKTSSETTMIMSNPIMVHITTASNAFTKGQQNLVLILARYHLITCQGYVQILPYKNIHGRGLLAFTKSSTGLEAESIGRKSVTGVCVFEKFINRKTS